MTDSGRLEDLRPGRLNGITTPETECSILSKSNGFAGWIPIGRGRTPFDNVDMEFSTSIVHPRLLPSETGSKKLNGERHELSADSRFPCSLREACGVSTCSLPHPENG